MAIISSCSSFLPSIQLIHTTYCFYALYRLWESATSHLLGLHQLRHGTSPINYIKIQIYGLNPEVASKSHGEATYFNIVDPGRNEGPRERRVYVMKDRSSFPCVCKKGRWRMCGRFALTKRLNALEYAYQAGAAMFAFEQMPPKLRAALMKIGGILGYMTPILKFHFDPNDLNCFQNDPWLSCVALRTNQSVSSARLGLIGALRAGLNGRFVERIRQDPKKFGIGVFQALAALAITFKLFHPAQTTLKTYAIWIVVHTAFLSTV
jgi:hypothetical protein